MRMLKDRRSSTVLISRAITTRLQDVERGKEEEAKPEHDCRHLKQDSEEIVFMT